MAVAHDEAAEGDRGDHDAGQRGKLPGSGRAKPAIVTTIAAAFARNSGRSIGRRGTGHELLHVDGRLAREEQRTERVCRGRGRVDATALDRSRGTGR